MDLYIVDLQGLDRTILMRALKLLDHKGKLAIFKGTSADDKGVKILNLDLWTFSGAIFCDCIVVRGIG